MFDQNGFIPVLFSKVIVIHRNVAFKVDGEKHTCTYVHWLLTICKYDLPAYTQNTQI